MTEFVLLGSALEFKAKNVKGTVGHISELKTKAGANWRLKVITLRDQSGELSITCWNEDIEKFAHGKEYEVEGLWWKERGDKPGEWNASVGKYTKIKLLQNDNQTLESTPEKNIVSDTMGNQPKLSDASPLLLDFVGTENMLLLQIEKIITDQHKDLGIPINGQQIGMHTREIYLQSKKSNLTKASDIKIEE